MKIKTHDLQGAALDWAVAKCEGYKMDTSDSLKFAVIRSMYGKYKYSENRNLAGPIIDREGISTIRCDDEYDLVKSSWLPVWAATSGKHSPRNYDGVYYDPQYEIKVDWCFYGNTSLIAAMRCYVALKLGVEVEIPEDLLK